MQNFDPKNDTRHGSTHDSTGGLSQNSIQNSTGTGQSYFKMVDVGDKAATHRRAQAQGRIELTPSAMRALLDLKNPKGNVLALAESAGIMAAKNVAQLLPLCHPLPIEQVKIFFEMEEARNSVVAFCEVSVTAKTGAEMEALAGVNGALLCIYDLSKAVDPVLKITDVRLNLKTGGKSGHWTHPDLDGSVVEAESRSLSSAAGRTSVASALQTAPLAGRRAAVMTISDRASQGLTEDRSGPTLAGALREVGAEIVKSCLLPDERAQIAGMYRQLALETDAELIISTGGTGISPRDVTPEALQDVCERMIPGFGELLRADGARHIGTSWLSRSTAGICHGKLLIALPGSSKAVSEGLNALMPLLPHALHTLKGGDHAVS